MEAEIKTPRLKLSRLLVADEAHRDLQWFHSVWSNDQATKWSPSGPRKTLAQSKVWMAGVVPSPDVDMTNRIAYAVLTSRPPDPSQLASIEGKDARDSTDNNLKDDWNIAGIVTLLPDSSAQSDGEYSPCSPEKQRLALELGYLFLPLFWGCGYATESSTALLDEYRRFMASTNPATVVEISAKVHVDNLPSIRVLKKLGFQEVARSEHEGLVYLDGKERRSIAVHFRKTIEGIV